MARIARNWNRLNRKARIAAARLIHTKLTGNADVPTPNPSLTALDALIVAAKAADDDVDAAEQALKTKRSLRDAKIDSMVAGINQEASTVEGATGGDPTKLLGAGFLLAETTGAPVGELPAPQDLRATAGDNDGELDGHWDPVQGARTYEVQTTGNPNDATTWVTRASVTRSSVTIAGLPSGNRCWVRVRGIGAAGPGAWSDPSAKMVP